MHAEGQGPPSVRTATLSSDAWLTVVVALSLLLGGCKDINAIFGELTEEVRGREAAEGRSGTLRGLEVAHTAANVATRLSEAPTAECAIGQPDGGYKYVLEMKIEREARDKAPLEWTETRTFTVDASGDLRLQMEARYADELGNVGVHRPVQMLVGSMVYEGPDAEHIYRRESGAAAREAMMARGRGTLQALLDAAPGWAVSESGDGWNLGSERLRCDVEDEASRGWLRRLETRGTVVEAKLEKTENSRAVEIRWLLEDGVVMQVHAEDRVVGFEGDVEAPSEAKIIDVRRDRSWKAARDLLDRLEREGAIEPVSSEVHARED